MENQLKSALLIMDAQNQLVEWSANAGAALDRIRVAIKAARSGSVPVIFVKVGFREGYHEIHPNNSAFFGMKQSGSGLFLEDDSSSQLHEAIEVQKDDIIITKKRVSAFAGSDLAITLRSLKIERLVIAGFFTSGVVLSTVREAADLDYKLTVLADGCSDADVETHEFLVKKIFPAQARVLDVTEWVNTLA